MFVKHCYRCKRDLPVECFSRNRSKQDGLSEECKDCKRAWRKEYNHRHEVKEQKADYQRRYRSDPVVLERKREYARSYMKSYKVCHRDRMSGWRKQYVATHSDRLAFYRKTRRARLKKASPTLTKSEWTRIINLYESRCAYCGQVIEKPTMDHVVPLSRGGKHSSSNVVPACMDCNLRKNARTPEEAGMEFSIKVNLLEVAQQQSLW